MNYKLIMLPQPILISDEKIKGGDILPYVMKWENGYEVFNLNNGIRESKLSRACKIIAGIEGLPNLDLSLIADEIGWVDVLKLTESFINNRPNRTSLEHDLLLGIGFTEGFKAAQSLNEKKYSEEDIKYAMFQVFKNGCRSPKEGREGFGEIYNRVIQPLSKPKEYLVEVQTERTRYPKGDDGWEDVYTPKITNNTIKILKLC